MKIKEVILVEGKDDVARIKMAVDAEVIQTGGSHISKDRLNEIVSLYKKRGLIILTDPDYSGNKIRSKIKALCPEAKEAFIDRERASKDGDIGVENASVKAILDALSSARANVNDKKENYSSLDLYELGLTGHGSSQKRYRLCKFLGLGRLNSKGLLNRLNSFAISREELEKAIEETLKDEK